MLVPDALRGYTLKRNILVSLGIRIFHKIDGRMCKKDIIKSPESTD